MNYVMAKIGFIRIGNKAFSIMYGRWPTSVSYEQAIKIAPLVMTVMNIRLKKAPCNHKTPIV